MNRTFCTNVFSAVAILASTPAILLHAAPPATQPAAHNVYYYDLGSNKLFIAKDTEDPPIAAPSGNDAQAVRAYIFGCGDCKDHSKLKVAYLEMFTAAAKKELAVNASAPGKANAEKIKAGHLIRTLANPAWTPIGSPGGAATIKQIEAKCGDAKFVYCEPAQPATQPATVETK